MLRQTSTNFKRALGLYPNMPKRKLHRSGTRVNRYTKEFWRKTQDPERERGSFWVSDFKHRYLVKTGTDFRGQVPNSPAPGTYQTQPEGTVTRMLKGHPRPQRESRHLPVHPMDARFVYEYRSEKKLDWMRMERRDKRIINEVKDLEFHDWYTNKLQRVRGKWCRSQGIASRGVYGPEVDAAELWS